jgi:glycosyltransferase involved in cell wall biosynthesis
MPARLILDLSRLVFTGWRRTPAGIPRVELAYAEHFIANYSERLNFVVLDAFGRLSILENRMAIAFVKEIAAYWRGDVASTRAYLRVALRALSIHAVLLLQYHGSLRHLVARVAGPCIYVILSQLHMERTKAIKRLKSAGNLRLVYFVHDIIPVLFPEYCPAKEEVQARRRLQGAAQFADVIVVNSQDTARIFRETFGKHLPPNSIVVAPLGVNVSRLPEPQGNRSVESYFVMVGTIEPRKNHLMILNLWRKLGAELGSETPRLIVIGARGWENENVIDMLERSPALRHIVEERSRVSDEEMARLLRDARALLMPSFAEGYGLPLAETLALGVPALCSDIPALREVGGDVPEFIDPIDGLSWRGAILDYAAHISPRRDAQLKRLESWKPTSWETHFGKVSDVLDAPKTGP